MSNTWLYGGLAALLAGVFEETGRFLAFKFLLKKRTGRKTAISYGIGHGGFEAVFLLVFTGIQYLTYISLINSGQFSTVVDQARAVSPDQVAAVEAIPATLAAITIGSIGITDVPIGDFSARILGLFCSPLPSGRHYQYCNP
jgi:uncharacterized membrane protein YhfC